MAGATALADGARSGRGIARNHRLLGACRDTEVPRRNHRAAAARGARGSSSLDSSPGLGLPPFDGRHSMFLLLGGCQAGVCSERYGLQQEAYSELSSKTPSPPPPRSDRPRTSGRGEGLCGGPMRRREPRVLRCRSTQTVTNSIRCEIPTGPIPVFSRPASGKSIQDLA